MQIIHLQIFPSKEIFYILNSGRGGSGGREEGQACRVRVGGRESDRHKRSGHLTLSTPGQPWAQKCLNFLAKMQ